MSIIKVINLPEDCTEAELTKIFTPFGSLVSICVCTEQTRYALVTYEDRETAERVIAATNNTSLRGSVINVALCPPATPLCDYLALNFNGAGQATEGSIFQCLPQGLILKGPKDGYKFSLGHIMDSDSERASSKGSFSFSLEKQQGYEHCSIQLPDLIAGTKHRRPIDDPPKCAKVIKDISSTMDSGTIHVDAHQRATCTKELQDNTLSLLPSPHKSLFNEHKGLIIIPPKKGKRTTYSGIPLGEASSVIEKEEVYNIDSSNVDSFTTQKHPLLSLSIDQEVKPKLPTQEAITKTTDPKIDLSHLHNPSKSPSPRSDVSNTTRAFSPPSFMKSSPCSPVQSPVKSSAHSKSLSDPVISKKKPPFSVPLNTARPSPIHHIRQSPQPASPAPPDRHIAVSNRSTSPIHRSPPSTKPSLPTSQKASLSPKRLTHQSLSMSSQKQLMAPTCTSTTNASGPSLSHLKKPVQPQPMSRSIQLPGPVMAKVLMHNLQTKKRIQKIKCDTKVSTIKIIAPPTNNPSGVPTISITGEPEKVEKAFPLVQEKLLEIKHQLQTKNYCMNMFFAPLFLMKDSEIFESVRKMEDENCVSFFVQRVNGKKYPLAMFSSLVQASNSLLKVLELYKAELLMAPMSWSIQSFSGNWFPLPLAANDYFNKCLRDSIKSFHYTDTENGIIYEMNLEKMEAVNTQQGVIHSLKAEPSQVCTWRGVVPYTDAEAVEIEMCLRQGVVRSINCSGRQCYFDFHSSMEINMSNGQATTIRREPSIPSEYLNPCIKIVVQGMSVDKAVQQFDSLLQSKLEEEVVPMLSSNERSTHSSLVVQFVEQYCVRGTCSALGDMIQVQGIDKSYIAKVIVELMKNVSQFQFAPSRSLVSNFQTPLGWCPQVNDTEVFDVACGSNDWNSIQKLWDQTCHSLWTIARIQRVQSKWLWRQYALSKERLIYKNSGKHNEMLLFHGTSTTNPADIYNSERGFDARFSRPGMWGTGIYFAVNASYSAKSYAYEQLNKSRQIFLARVLTGDSMMCKPSRSLKMPPLKSSVDGCSERYDSIKGETGNSVVYIVYDQDKAYPEFLITFNKH